MRGIMDFREFQIESRKTDVGTSAQDNLKPGWLYYALGISGEAGELTEKIKKLFRDKKGEVDQEFLDSVIKEMGDILWYMGRLADTFGIDFNLIAETNIIKLLDRMEHDKIHGDGDNR